MPGICSSTFLRCIACAVCCRERAVVARRNAGDEEVDDASPPRLNVGTGRRTVPQGRDKQILPATQHHPTRFFASILIKTASCDVVSHDDQALRPSRHVVWPYPTGAAAPCPGSSPRSSSVGS